MCSLITYYITFISRVSGTHIIEQGQLSAHFDYARGCVNIFVMNTLSNCLIKNCFCRRRKTRSKALHLAPDYTYTYTEAKGAELIEYRCVLMVIVQ